MYNFHDMEQLKCCSEKVSLMELEECFLLLKSILRKFSRFFVSFVKHTARNIVSSSHNYISLFGDVMILALLLSVLSNCVF